MIFSIIKHQFLIIADVVDQGIRLLILFSAEFGKQDC